MSDVENGFELQPLVVDVAQEVHVNTGEHVDGAAVAEFGLRAEVVFSRFKDSIKKIILIKGFQVAGFRCEIPAIPKSYVIN